MPNRSKLLYRLVGAAGLLACVRGMYEYGHAGFNSHLWLYWLIGCSALTVSVFSLSRPPASADRGLRWFARGDWIILLVGLVVFAPLYMYGVRDFPRQMNTDEIAIMNAERILSSDPGVDIFGPSFYSDLPTLIFWLLGKIGVLLGGVNLGHMRLVHAGSGVLIVLLVYVLLRLLRLPRLAAVAGMVTVGTCHSLFFLSRMAMRDNTALLFELCALILLFYAWRRRHTGWALLGGFAAGLTVYTYYPSRITLAVWAAFMTAYLVLHRFRDWRTVLRLSGAVLIGACIMAAPLYIATARHVPTDPYPAHQFLWQPEAREQERQYRQVATVAEALRINALHGLATFNAPYGDQGMMYMHDGYGFVDALTGVLIWLGAAAILARSFYRRSIRDEDLFGLVGFMGIYLSLALLLTRAPDYTRLLVILPFIGYLVGRLIVLISALGRRKYIMPVAASLVILSVTALNASIIHDFWRSGARDGDGVGDTLRYQEDRAGEDATWLLVYGGKNYFYWGVPQYWRGWLEFPKGPNQTVDLVSIDQLLAHDTHVTSPSGHGYLLTTGDVWMTVKSDFAAKQRIVSVSRLDPAGNRVVVRYVNKPAQPE